MSETKSISLTVAEASMVLAEKAKDAESPERAEKLARAAMLLSEASLNLRNTR